MRGAREMGQEVGGRAPCGGGAVGPVGVGAQLVGGGGGADAQLVWPGPIRVGGDCALELERQPVAREGAGEGDGAEAAVLVGLGGLAEAGRGRGIEGEAEAEQVVERGVVAVQARAVRIEPGAHEPAAVEAGNVGARARRRGCGPGRAQSV